MAFWVRYWATSGESWFMSGRTLANQPLRTAVRVAVLVLLGSTMVMKSYCALMCEAGVPWNQSGVGISLVQGWAAPTWLGTVSRTTFMPRAWAARTRDCRSAMVPRWGSTAYMSVAL